MAFRNLIIAFVGAFVLSGIVGLTKSARLGRAVLPDGTLRAVRGGGPGYSTTTKRHCDEYNATSPAVAERDCLYHAYSPCVACGETQSSSGVVDGSYVLSYGYTDVPGQFAVTCSTRLDGNCNDVYPFDCVGKAAGKCSDIPVVKQQSDDPGGPGG